MPTSIKAVTVKAHRLPAKQSQAHCGQKMEMKPSVLPYVLPILLQASERAGDLVIIYPLAGNRG